MAGFSVGLSGMQATSKAIDTVSNNIANSGTIGYKGGEYLFSDEFVKTTQANGGGTEGLGVSGMGIRREFTTGVLRATASPLDLAISGSGLFRLATAPDTTGQAYYSRNGQFSVDKNGYIVNANGLFLTGYAPKPDGTGVTTDLTALKLPPSSISPVQTQEAKLAVNLDTRALPKTQDVNGTTSLKPFEPDDPTTYAYSASQTLFDASGIQHNLTTFYRRVNDNVGTLTPAGTAGYTMTLADGAGGTRTVSVPGKIVTQPAPSSGGAAVTYLSMPDGTKLPVGGTADAPTLSLTQYEVYAMVDGAYFKADGTKETDGTKGPGRLTTMSFVNGMNIDSLVKDAVTGNPLGFTKVQLSAQVNTVSVDGTSAPMPLQFSLDLTGTMNYASENRVTDSTQDGRSVGSMTSVGFDEDGRLVAKYSNGKSWMAGQITLANFNATSGLQPIGANTFAETQSSGEAIIGAPNTGALGSIRTSALEESNIDMANELVKLLIQQRNYQANSQSIRTQDQLLQTTIGLVN